MENQKDNRDNIDHLNLLRKIQNNPDASQRELAKQLGFSLGKHNYCLSALKSKGFVKANNFRNNKNKQNNDLNLLFFEIIIGCLLYGI